jgi:hypothetical protein
VAETKSVLGTPLFSNPSHWSVAKRKAAGIIALFKKEILPVKELLSKAPKNITSARYVSGAWQIDS